MPLPGLLGLFLVIGFFKKQWIGFTLQLALYLMIPLIIYLGETDMAQWMMNPFERPYDLSFGFLALFVIFTLKFTRRRKGFKITPMDFLILFIALVVPNLPDEQIQSYHMGLLAAKIDNLVKSPKTVMPDLIRHPEVIEFTGFRLSPE